MLRRTVSTIQYPCFRRAASMEIVGSVSRRSSSFKSAGGGLSISISSMTSSSVCAEGLYRRSVSTVERRSDTCILSSAAIQFYTSRRGIISATRVDGDHPSSRLRRFQPAPHRVFASGDGLHLGFEPPGEMDADQSIQLFPAGSTRPRVATGWISSPGLLVVPGSITRSRRARHAALCSPGWARKRDVMGQSFPAAGGRWATFMEMREQSRPQGMGRE